METTIGVIVAVAIIGYGIYKYTSKKDSGSVGSGGSSKSEGKINHK